MSDLALRNKAILINYLGGKCVECGGITNLEFDHIDPSTKTFTIGRNLEHGIDKLIEEVKKCQLMCFTCHLKKHNHLVEHGGGVSGKFRCKCALCKAKRSEYDRNRREERISGKSYSSTSSGV